MAEWKSDVEKDATFMPQTIDTSNEEDYNVWKTESRGWRKLEASLRGGSALNSEAGEAHAATLVSPQSLVDSAVTFHKIRDALVWLENFIRDQVQAVAGPDRAWQGAAANAFLTKMDLLAEHVGRNAERINGGEAYGPNSIPEALYRSAHYLQWGQEQIYHLDVSYAAIASDAGVGEGSGPVPISGSKFEKPMAEQMAQVVGTVATEYHSTYSQVQPPTEGTVPIPSPTLGNHTTPPPISITTPPPISTPPLLSITPPPSLNVTTPPPLNVTTPPPLNAPPLVTQPPFVPPAISPPGGAPEVTLPNFDPTGGGAANFQPPPIGAPPGAGGLGGGLPGLGGGPAPTGGNGAFVPPVVGNVPGFDGGPKAGANTVKPPTVGGPPNAGSGGGGAGGADFKPPALASPPGGAGSGLGSGIPGTGGIDLPEVAPPPAGGGLGGGSGGGSGSGMPPMMPGSPGAGGGSPGAGGGGIPDPSDAGGLLGGDAEDWTSPGIGAVDAPDAPFGASPGGGAGLGQSPMMPGMPGSGGGGPGAGGSGVPDASDASGLVAGDEADWQSPVIGAVDAPDAPLGAAPGGAGLGQSPMMPGMPGGGPGSAGSGSAEAPDAQGLVAGDVSTWQPSGTDYELPGSPGGAEAGGAGLTAAGYDPPSGTGFPSDVEGPVAGGADETGTNQTAGGGVPMAGPPPMMPGGGGPGAGQPGGGAGIPDAPDAQGLVDADLADWQPAGGGLGDPSAPQGTAAGGAGLEVPHWEQPGELPSTADPAFGTADEVALQEYGSAEGASDAPAGMPVMPGFPGGAAPPGPQSSADGTGASELIDADTVDWQPAETGTIPHAPDGAAAGGAGLQTSVDIPPPAIPVESVVSLPGTDGPTAEWPTVDGPVTPAPAMDGPVMDGPVTDGSVVDGPVTPGPVVDGPLTDGPVEDRPVTHAPVTHAPVTHAPVTHAPVTHAPVTHAPVTHAPAMDGPAMHAPAMDGPVAGGPAAGETVVGEPSAEEPSVDGPAVYDPVVIDPVATDPGVVEPPPIGTEPTVSQPVTADPVTADPATTDPVAVDPGVAEPVQEPIMPTEPVQDDGTGLQTPPAGTDAVPLEKPAVQQMAATAADAPTDPGDDDATAPTAPAVVLPVPQAVVPQAAVPSPPTAPAPAALGRDAVTAGTLPGDPRLAAAIPPRPPSEDDRETPERPDSAELLQDGSGAWNAAGPADGTPAGDDFVPVITVDDDDMSSWDDVDGAAWLTDASPRG